MLAFGTELTFGRVWAYNSLASALRFFRKFANIVSRHVGELSRFRVSGPNPEP